MGADGASSSSFCSMAFCFSDGEVESECTNWLACVRIVLKGVSASKISASTISLVKPCGVKHVLGIRGSQADEAHQVIFLLAVPVARDGFGQFARGRLRQLPGISPQLVIARDEGGLGGRSQSQAGEMLGCAGDI